MTSLKYTAFRYELLETHRYVVSLLTKMINYIYGYFEGRCLAYCPHCGERAVFVGRLGIARKGTVRVEGNIL